MARKTKERPAAKIARFVEERAAATDDAVLAELAAFEPLPPEADAAWQADATWDRALRLVALADVVAARRLKSGVESILAATSFGDSGETMRGLRHAFEATYAPDCSELATVCERASRSDRPVARLWATAQLGILRERSSFACLVERLGDDERAIREEAGRSLQMLCRAHADLIAEACAALRAAVDADPADGLAEELAALT